MHRYITVTKNQWDLFGVDVKLPGGTAKAMTPAMTKKMGTMFAESGGRYTKGFGFDDEGNPDPDGVNVLRGYVKSGPARDPDAVGLSKLTSVWTHSLKAPGFNHRTYQVRKPGFKVYIFKFNLYRYA